MAYRGLIAYLVVMLPLIWGMNQLGRHAAAQSTAVDRTDLLYVLFAS